MEMERAMEQHHQRQVERIPLSEKWKSLSPAVEEMENNASGGFDCNICLDAVLDPVVTFCGHLYCWPCIYKWIHSQNSCAEDGDHKHPQCPVCKAEVSEKTLIPLYGRGLSQKPSEGKTVIPQRPPSPRCAGHVLIATATASNDSRSSQHLHHRSYPQHAPSQQPYYPGSYSVAPMLNLSGTGTNALNHPMIGMIGEMVYSGMFRNSGSSLYAYPNSPNSYHLAAGGTSPRIRRQILQADRSMGRLCFFLCCCVVICLLLF